MGNHANMHRQILVAMTYVVQSTQTLICYLKFGYKDLFETPNRAINFHLFYILKRKLMWSFRLWPFFLSQNWYFAHQTVRLELTFYPSNLSILSKLTLTYLKYKKQHLPKIRSGRKKNTHEVRTWQQEWTIAGMPVIVEYNDEIGKEFII